MSCLPSSPANATLSPPLLSLTPNPPQLIFSSLSTLYKPKLNSKNSHSSSSITTPRRRTNPSRLSSALTDSSPSASQPLLQELADCFDLPQDYFLQLPGDLRLDLNDAAFDLSNGPVLDECGQELGVTLLNLSRAWEQADTGTSHALAGKLPMLEASLSDSAKAAFGKRLVSAGRRFQTMGQYGQGELQKIARVMTSAGKLLSASSMSIETDEKPKAERTLKFGDLEVEITPEKANIGAAIGLAYGILSWQLGQGVQGIPESSLQYANDNALLLAKSLRGALLSLCYSSALLSAVTTVGLLILARQLKSKEE